MKYIILILILLPHHAYSNWCDNHKGWHFYCEEQEAPEDPYIGKEYSPQMGAYYTAKVREREARLKGKLNRAIEDRTTTNVTDYRREQHEFLGNTKEFSNLWAKSVILKPDLDPTIKNPNSSVGLKISDQVQRDQIAQAVQDASDRYGLFFFYKSSCPYCIEYSPILKRFANKYNFDVIAISTDGGILPQWADSRINTTESEKLGIAGKSVPATVLYDSKMSEAIPIAFGLMTIDELEERIFILTRKE